MPETDNQQLQKKLNDIQGKIAFLKQEQARNEEEKKSIEKELLDLGIDDPSKLEKIIQDKEKEWKETEAKYTEAVKKLEEKVDALVSKVKGV